MKLSDLKSNYIFFKLKCEIIEIISFNCVFFNSFLD